MQCSRIPCEEHRKFEAFLTFALQFHDWTNFVAQKKRHLNKVALHLILGICCVKIAVFSV